METKIDKKIEFYKEKFKKSEEGKSALEVLAETKKLLESPEAKELLEGTGEAMKELRGFLKQLRERATQSGQEEEEEEDIIPPLKKKAETA